MEWIAFAASALTAILSFLGVYISNRKAAAVMEWRIKSLEDKVDKHNSFDRRLVAVETKLEIRQDKQ